MRIASTRGRLKIEAVGLVEAALKAVHVVNEPEAALEPVVDLIGDGLRMLATAEGIAARAMGGEHGDLLPRPHLVPAAEFAGWPHGCRERRRRSPSSRSRRGGSHRVPSRALHAHWTKLGSTNQPRASSKHLIGRSSDIAIVWLDADNGARKFTFIKGRPPPMSFTERTKTGLRDIPSNAAWLLSRALKPKEAVEAVAEAATVGVKDRGRRVQAAVVDAVPVGGDSVEARMRRAQDAGTQARAAEQHAAEVAQESKDRSEHARQVSEDGRTRLKELNRELERRVKQRVADAQKAADEAVQREQHAAKADAEQQLSEEQDEVNEAIENARHEAEEARQLAAELVEDAAEKLAEAKRLADEAAQAAHAAAEEAQRQARQLATDAQHQADHADAQVKATEELRSETVSSAKHAARELDTTDGGLASYNKPELVELAASIDIDGRTTMTKPELVDAITKAARKK